MALYHFHAGVQSGGALNVAAYCAGKKLRPSGHVKPENAPRNHSGKNDVRSTELLFPEGYKAPFGGGDGPIEEQLQRLWGAVEEREKYSTRHNEAQYLRQFEISLPVELDCERQAALIRSWVEEELIRRGLIVQLSIHDGHYRDGAWNPHAHLLITMRELVMPPEHDTEGKSLFSYFGRKLREFNRREFLKELRISWEEAQNQALEAAGSEARVSALSYKERGLPLTPTRHLGAIATSLQSHSKQSRRALQNAYIKAENQRRQTFSEDAGAL